MLDKLQLVFSDNKLPTFKKVSGKGYLSFGEENKYPNTLLYLFDKSAKHNAIIDGKAKYIFGGGLKPADENNIEAKAWAQAVNTAGDTLDEIGKKSITDIEVFSGFAWQIIPTMGAKPEIYHLPFDKVRSNADNSILYYKNDWSDSREEVKSFPAFNINATEPTIFYFKEYRPGQGTYPLPGYIGSINFIESDIEVSKHTLTAAKRGWRPTKMINFFNGEPTPEAKKEISKKFKEKTEGSEGDTFLISYNNDPTKKPTIDDLGASDLVKEDFSQVDNLISQNIYAGHQITSPILFGIKTEGQLGGATELQTAYEIFKNTYVNHKQQQFEKVLNKFVAAFGLQTTFLFEPTDPVSVAGQPGATAGESQMVNDHLKNLTGRQQQQLERVIRKYEQGKLTEQAAKAMLKSSLGLSDEDIIAILGLDQPAEFSAQYDEEAIAEMFEEIGEGRDAFTVVKTKPCHFTSQDNLIKEELELRESFDEEAEGVADKVRKITRKFPKLEIKYSYEPRTGLAPIIDTTRPFCRKLIQLDRLYSRKEIESISERVNYNVFELRGGFWGNKRSCRHIWKSNIVIKK